jgi:hypothetical protein
MHFRTGSSRSAHDRYLSGASARHTTQKRQGLPFCGDSLGGSPHSTLALLFVVAQPGGFADVRQFHPLQVDLISRRTDSAVATRADGIDGTVGVRSVWKTAHSDRVLTRIFGGGEGAEMRRPSPTSPE